MDHLKVNFRILMNYKLKTEYDIFKIFYKDEILEYIKYEILDFRNINFL